MMQNNRRKYFPTNLKRNSIKNNHIDDDGDCGDGSSSVHSQRSMKCQLYVANELNGNNINNNRNNNREMHHSQLNSLMSGRVIHQQQQQPEQPIQYGGEKNRLIRQSFEGTDCYLTAEDESAADADVDERKTEVATVTPSMANGRFLRHKFPAHKYKLVPMTTTQPKNSKTNFRFSSYSDDEDVKESLRERKKILSKSKPASATSMSATTPVAVAQQNSADVSTFIQKKSLAQGMMDLALMSANTNQLRYILEYRNDHPYFLTSLTLVIGSLFLQLAVGLTLIWNTRFNVRKRTEMLEADRVNNISVIAIFMITLINVFLSTFGGGPQAATAAATLTATSKSAIEAATRAPGGIELVTVTAASIATFSPAVGFSTATAMPATIGTAMISSAATTTMVTPTVASDEPMSNST